MLMSPAEEGAYIRLLAIAWNSEDCGLPDDDGKLAILSRLNEGWFNGSSSVVRQCFFSDGGRLYNKRLLDEREKQQIWREKSAEGGRRSGKVRRANAKQYAKGGSRVVEPNTNITSPSSSTSTSKKTTKIHTRKSGASVYDEQFERFWLEYPRKTGKREAYKSWVRIAPDAQMTDMLIASIGKQWADYYHHVEIRFIPHPATWLNGERWSDNFEKGAPEKKEDRSWEQERKTSAYVPLRKTL